MKILGPGWPEVERYALKRPTEAGGGGGGNLLLCSHTYGRKQNKQWAVYTPDLPLIF